jgi:hypothetical protein
MHVPKTRIIHRAYDAATMLHISQAQRTPPRTCRLAPRSPTPSTTNTRAQTHELRQAPPTTTARQRHGACHPKQRSTTRHATHIAHSHAEYRHTSPARPHDVPHSRNHCALRNHHRIHTAARTPRTARPTENHTQSHTRPPRHTHVRAVRLPSVDGMLPESWLLYKYKYLQDTRTAIASHHGTRRRRRPQPATHNAARRIAQHQSGQVK